MAETDGYIQLRVLRETAHLFFTARFNVNPERLSVIVKLNANSPAEFPPQWPTVSASMKPVLVTVLERSFSGIIRLKILDPGRVKQRLDLR